MTDTTKLPDDDDPENLHSIIKLALKEDGRVLSDNGELVFAFQLGRRLAVSRLDAMREALRLAEAALSDLQACPDPACPVESCNRALPTIRALLAKDSA